MIKFHRHALVAFGVMLIAVSVSAEFSGFVGPVFGIATAPNGDILVADAGAGVTGIDVRKGRIRDTIPLPGVTSISPLGRGSMWAVTGAGADAEADTGQGLHRISRGQTRKLANLFAFEEQFNPDFPRSVDSNPFDVQSLGGNAAVVADAGANDLLHVDNQGNVNVLAIFPDELVSTDNIKALAGCPGSGADFCFLPPMFPAQPVPTSVVIDESGYYLVGELKGFPAPTGASNIWLVSSGAQWAECGSSPDCIKLFDGGFTSIIDMTFGPDGHLYVAEFDAASWAAVEIFGMPSGGVIKACDLSTLTCHEIASGIDELTGITFGKDGALYATRHALVPGGAEVIRVD